MAKKIMKTKFLIEWGCSFLQRYMAAIYTEIIQDDIGGNLIFEGQLLETSCLKNRDLIEKLFNPDQPYGG